MNAESFRWNEWNLDHATCHGVTVREIESIVRRAVRANRQEKAGDGKWIVTGRGQGDRLVQVVFADEDEWLYVIHAMPLTTRRRRR